MNINFTTKYDIDQIVDFGIFDGQSWAIKHGRIIGITYCGLEPSPYLSSPFLYLIQESKYGCTYSIQEIDIKKVSRKKFIEYWPPFLSSVGPIITHLPLAENSDSSSDNYAAQLVDAGFKPIKWLTQQELKELQAAKWELKDAE